MPCFIFSTPKQRRNPFRFQPCYIAFSPAVAAHQELASALDDGVRQLRLSGELAQIAERYKVPPAFFDAPTVPE
ncbi:hypothetical protein [Alteromonas halophila]|uniref:Transporter substrate-binding domain-containing protein n=1 Tax=Alteromonas halophila TaxID=516698 RepID=A0A918MXM0_9ALTE|nr:hypothetical protein [Alteromonas halophila]GGW80748.1 hypothetical protein GCM10007391_12130 [Alteromonas halophila]